MDAIPSPIWQTHAFGWAEVMHDRQIQQMEKAIRSQFQDESALAELRALGDHYDWVARTEATLDRIIPELPALAKMIVKLVPARFNSANTAMQMLDERANDFDASPDSKRWFENLRQAVESSASLISHLESQQISAEIQRVIVSESAFGSIVYPNGNSIYPDLILKGHEYDKLPFQTRGKKSGPIIGPCVQGKVKPRPSNVPDGCEIKTNRGNRIRVDAHAPHPGLHLGVTWDKDNRSGVQINGVWAAYVRISDHKESARNSKTTTVKYSFGHSLFVEVPPAD